MDKLQIEITFFYENMHFKLARGNETRLESSPDGMSWTLISENSNEINKFIESTLDVSAHKFRDLFYSAQGHLTDVITGSPEERQKSIDKLLGAEGLRETYGYLAEFVKYYDKDIGNVEGKLSDIKAYLKRHNLDELRDAKREAEREVIEINEKIDTLSEKISSLSVQLENLQSRAEPLEEASAKVQSTSHILAHKESDLTNKNFQIKELEKSLSLLDEQSKTNHEKLDKLRPELKQIEDLLGEKESLHEKLNDLMTKARSLVDQESHVCKNIESLENETQNEKDLERIVEGQITDADGKLSQQASDRKKRNEELIAAQRTVESLNGQISPQEDELRSCELKVGTTHHKLIEYAEKIQRLNSLTEGANCPFCEQPISRTHRTKVAARLETSARQVLKEEEAAKLTADRSRKILEELKNKTESANETVNKIKQGISLIETEIAREDQNKHNLSKNLEDCRKRRSRLEEDLRREKDSLDGIRNEIGKIVEASGTDAEDWTEVLKTHIEEGHQERQKLRDHLTGIDGEIRLAESLLKQAKNETEKKTTAIQDYGNSIALLSSEISAAREKIVAIYEPLIGQAEDPQAKLSEMISEITTEIQKLREPLKEKELSRVRLSGEYKRKEDQIAQFAQQIAEYLEEEKRSVQLKRTMTVYSEAKNLLQQIRDKYKDAREMIRTNLINVLRETLCAEFDHLYVYDDFTDIKVSENYEVSLVSPIGEIQAHNLSAGQKAIVAIAFRLAVARAMEMKIGCWIIDEPTQNIGNVEVEALAEVLGEKGKIPQIIVASHHPTLGRHGNVISLEVRNSETVLGEGIHLGASDSNGRGPETVT